MVKIPKKAYFEIQNLKFSREQIFANRLFRENLSTRKLIFAKINLREN